MIDFKTIKNDITTEIIVKKSKFIASLIYVDSVKNAEEKIKDVKKKYFDAKHNCVAYRIIEDEKIVEKASDDGEPSGTAGGPMLHILQSNNLSNILIVVTRYFGGILLGTGGLVRSYSEALQKAIEESEIVEKCMGEELEVVLEYSEFEQFQYYCKNNNITITDVQYLQDIICKIETINENKQKLIKDYEVKKIKINQIRNLSKKIINKSK